MIWVDREAIKIKARSLPVEWVDDMKTPSGRIHVGSLRGVLVHDLIYKVMKENGINTRFSYVFNDMDPMDAIPSYLDQKKWSKYAGQSLYKVPSPEAGFKSFAEFYAQEFIDVFNSINCHPEIIWSHELYESGKMNDVIKRFLDNAEKVKDIYKRVAKAERNSDWIPFNPICEKCSNIGTTNAYKWDGEFVYYRCESDMVTWAKGCGHEGKISPYNGTGKLPWKLDWPAHWKVIGVTVESSGKDHMSSGGSYDMASHFCKEILSTDPPYAMGGYEWFTIGGKKMSSSKGIGTSAKEVASILPPEVFRFLIVRTPINTHLEFNPFGETIPNLFDDYDRCMNAYFDKCENKIQSGKQGEVLSDFSRIAELSSVRPHSKIRLLLPRFRTVVNLIKMGKNVKEHFEIQLKRPLLNEESLLLEERIKYAKIYLEKYTAQNLEQNQQKVTEFILTENQKTFLKTFSAQLKTLKTVDREAVQNLFFEQIKISGLKPKEVFNAFYHTLTGKPFGPKAADLILQLGISEVINKLSIV